MDERLVMIGIEIQRLAVVGGRFGMIAGGVAHQAHQMKRLRRRTIL